MESTPPMNQDIYTSKARFPLADNMTHSPVSASENSTIIKRSGMMPVADPIRTKLARLYKSSMVDRMIVTIWDHCLRVANPNPLATAAPVNARIGKDPMKGAAAGTPTGRAGSLDICQSCAKRPTVPTLPPMSQRMPKILKRACTFRFNLTLGRRSRCFQLMRFQGDPYRDNPHQLAGTP